MQTIKNKGPFHIQCIIIAILFLWLHHFQYKHHRFGAKCYTFLKMITKILTKMESSNDRLMEDYRISNNICLYCGKNTASCAFLGVKSLVSECNRSTEAHTN